MMVLMYVDRRAPRAGEMYVVIYPILVSPFNRPHNLKKMQRSNYLRQSSLLYTLRCPSVSLGRVSMCSLDEDFNHDLSLAHRLSAEPKRRPKVQKPKTRLVALW